MSTIGLDIGSVSMKGVVIDEQGDIIKSHYTKNHGLTETAREVLKNLTLEEEIKGVGITGSGKDLVSILVGGDVVESEIIAHYIATITKYPDVRTIMDIGGEDSKILLVNNGNLVAFNMNRECGGGTGAMIESIAFRMGVPLDEVGDTALRSEMRLQIPSKCGIFAQSAVVGKLNKGVPKEDILMGVARGLVGNYFAMLTKGLRLRPSYVFQGATAKNKALVHCFEEELQHEVLVPRYPELMGALGMALIARDEFEGETSFRGFDNFNHNFQTRTYYGDGCTNQCEITQVYEDDRLFGQIGNRCEKCIQS